MPRRPLLHTKRNGSSKPAAPAEDPLLSTVDELERSHDVSSTPARVRDHASRKRDRDAQNAVRLMLSPEPAEGAQPRGAGGTPSVPTDGVTGGSSSDGGRVTTTTRQEDQQALLRQQGSAGAAVGDLSKSPETKRIRVPKPVSRPLSRRVSDESMPDQQAASAEGRGPLLEQDAHSEECLDIVLHADHLAPDEDDLFEDEMIAVGNGPIAASEGAVVDGGIIGAGALLAPGAPGLSEEGGARGPTVPGGKKIPKVVRVGKKTENPGVGQRAPKKPKKRKPKLENPIKMSDKQATAILAGRTPSNSAAAGQANFAALAPVDPDWDEQSLLHESSLDASIQMNRDAFGQPVWTSRVALRDAALKKYDAFMVVQPHVKLSEADKNAWLLRHMVRYSSNLPDSMEWVNLLRHEYAMVIDIQRRQLAAELGVSLGVDIGGTTSSSGKEVGGSAGKEEGRATAVGRTAASTDEGQAASGGGRGDAVLGRRGGANVDELDVVSPGGDEHECLVALEDPVPEMPVPTNHQSEETADVLVFSPDTAHLPADQRELLGADGKTQTQEIIRARRQQLKLRKEDRVKAVKSEMALIEDRVKRKLWEQKEQELLVKVEVERAVFFFPTTCT